MSGLLRLLGFGRTSRATLESQVTDLRRRAKRLQRDLQAKTIELELTRQAREKADAEAIYWRQRAERFIDQIGLKTDIITAPAMTEPAAPPGDTLGDLFGGLNVDTINRQPSSPAAPSAAVLGVDADAARAALDEFHRTAVRPSTA